MKIDLTGNYDRMYRFLVQENSEVKKIVIERVRWFRKNPNDSRLRNHALTRRMTGRWAFSITNDIRIVYRWVGKFTVRFLAIGPHKQVYRK